MLRPELDTVKSMVGSSVFVIHDNQITPTVVNEVCGIQ